MAAGMAASPKASKASGKQVIVRINDRGPFHSSRIVDVSYTAALKLGLLSKGSQEVELERLLPDGGARLATVRRNAPELDARPAALAEADAVTALLVQNRAEIEEGKKHPDAADGARGDAAAAPEPAPGFYVQLGAFSRAGKAAEIRARIAGQGWVGAALDVVRSGALHRVLSGPFASRAEAQEALRGVPSSLGLRPVVVKR